MERPGFKKEDVKELTPFRHNLQGRALPHLPWYNPSYDTDPLPDFMEGEEWFHTIPSPKGGMEFLKGEAYEGAYFGVEPEKDTDISLTFLDFYYQHLSWPDILGQLNPLVEDVRNLATSLSKISVYQDLMERKHIRRPVITELEYIFGVSRSLYDHAQFVAANTWDKVDFEDREKSPIPREFSGMLDDNELIGVEDLKERYGLTDPLIEFYKEEAQGFVPLREFRDDVYHQGESIKFVFQDDDGIMVKTEERPFSEYDAWDEDQINENNLGPIWPFLGHLIGDVVTVLNRLSKALGQSLGQLPPKLAPDYNVYVRGPHIHHLGHVSSLQKDDPWGKDLGDSVLE